MTCTQCPAGTFSYVPGLVTSTPPCLPCAPGFFSFADGAPFCIPCAAGATSEAGASSCAPSSSGGSGSSPASSLTCAAADARAVPASLGLQLWPAAHPLNPEGVDLVVAPLATCQQMASEEACAAAATVAGADGEARYVVGTAAAFNMEADETLTCSG